MVRRFLAVLALALVAAPSASADVAAPQNLHGFLLRTDDVVARTASFPRTPAFAWTPVTAAESYELELSTSKSFSDNAVVYSASGITGPLTTAPLTLPWITGARYSFYAHVRAIVGGVEGPWSAPYGFNVRASGAPRSLSATVPNPAPGMVRWTPIDGATSHQVSFLYGLGVGEAKLVSSATTAADLREYYTLHNGINAANVIYWRVRAVRAVDGQTSNKLPVVSFGPWSARFRTVEPPLATTQPIALRGTYSRSGSSDIVSSDSEGGPGPGAHQLVPGFSWSGALSPAPDLFGACPPAVALTGVTCPLYRVYVYTDADCVNRVHVGDIVGSPAYVPRLTPPLNLPGDPAGLTKAVSLYLDDGAEGKTFDAGNDPVQASGIAAAASTTTTPTTTPTTGGDTTTTPPATTPPPPAASTTGPPPRTNGLWDNDWPTSRYYWTAVPVIPRITADGAVEYHDVAFGQDMCAAGNGLPFGKTSEPVTTNDAGVPYISGVVGSSGPGTATSISTSFYGKVVVSWKPAPGASTYEVQWNKQPSNWKTGASNLTTPATSALLDLAAGTWYYRVRGIDATLPGPTGMTWSDPVKVTILPRTFTQVQRHR